MNDIHDAIGRWHEGDGYGVELHEYLGMSWDEYARWAESGLLAADSPWADSQR